MIYLKIRIQKPQGGTYIMKRFTKLVVFSLVAIMLTSCSFGCFTTPEKSVDNFMQELKDMNIKAAKKHITNADMLDAGFDLKDKEMKANCENILSTFEYSLEVISSDDTTAYVRLSVEQPDMGKLTLAALENLIATQEYDSSLYNGDDSDPEAKEADRKSAQANMYKFMSEQITAKNYEIITAEYDLKLVKTKGKWLMELDKNFLSLIFSKTSLM